MLFTSLEFLLFFLPLVITINLLLPKNLQNIWLLATSLLFYTWGEPKFVLIMLLSITLNYSFGLKIEELRENNAAKRWILLITVILNLGLLFVYKYMNFVTAIINRFDPYVEVTDYVLPIGISFFTFQAMSYVIDVYRGEKAQRNILYVGLYISLFPQLIAGPIVRYGTIRNQFTDRKITIDSFVSGVFRFLIGFNKKMLLANILSVAADAAFEMQSISVTMAWLGAVCYTLQILFDFSGYSDMAIGLGGMMGFQFPENFNYPYISKTVTEFWRRWHMSLGTWFRDYVYFPLGGSRVKTRKRLILNLFLVWLAIGVWHGANWTFILWGILYGGAITIEKVSRLPEKLRGHSIFSGCYQIFTMISVILGWVLFRSNGIRAAAGYIRNMFGLRNGIAVIDSSTRFYFREYFVFIIVGILCATPIFRILREHVEQYNVKVLFVYETLMYTGQIVLFLVGISYLVISAHNPFIYFNF